MRTLLLLAFVAFFPLSASAQWTFDSMFPPGDLSYTSGNFGMHGVAVDPDGKVWIQDYAATDSVLVTSIGEMRGVRVVYVYNADGTEASISPIKFIDYTDGVTPRDTLGGYTFLNSSGAKAWEGRSNRGLRADSDGNILISSFKSVFKVDYETGAGLARTRSDEYCAQTQATTDDNGNVYTAPVCPGQPIKQYDSDLNFTSNVTAGANNFSRTVLVSPDGNTLFETDFENPFTIVHQRTEFTPFDSVGVTLAGLRVESTAINPVTGRYWFSSGNPLNGGNDYVDESGSELETNYTSQAWYAFEFADLFDETGAPVLNPTPVDSLLYNDPGTPETGQDPASLGIGRPRGLAFSPDGNTAYVVLYNKVGAVQAFTRMNTATEGVGTFAGALEQNRPNPFAGSTDIRFELDRAATVALRVYDTTGREVALLVDGALAAGPHSFRFDAGSLAAGVYVYTLNVEGVVSSRRMMVVR